MDHLIEHPDELTFDELLEAAMDQLDPDTDAYGIARMVASDPTTLATLTPNRRYHWVTFVEPEMVQVVDRRNALWAKHLLDRAG